MMITPAKAIRLVKQAEKEAAKKARAEAAIQRKARREKEKSDKKEKAQWIAEDKKESLKQVEEVAKVGDRSCAYSFRGRNTFTTDRQIALVKFFEKKGFKAERWDRYHEGTKYRDPDWPDDEPYTEYGVKISW